MDENTTTEITSEEDHYLTIASLTKDRLGRTIDYDYRNWSLIDAYKQIADLTVKVNLMMDMLTDDERS